MTRTFRPVRHATGLALVACVAAAAQWPARAATPVPPAAAATCFACHGAQGEGSAAGVPRLAGQNARYLERALSMFKAGTRNSAVMQPIASRLADAEMRELAVATRLDEAQVRQVAAYLSTLSPP